MASNKNIKETRIVKDLKKSPEELHKKPPVISGLMIKSDSYSDTTRHARDDDDWDRGDTHTSWHVNGLELSNDKYADINADFEVKVGDIVYLVYAVYSTGNSLGRDDNGRIDYISVHKSKELADSNATILRNKSKSNMNDMHDVADWTANIVSDSGVVIPYYIPWLGYFESLTEVYVSVFVVS